MGNGQTVEYFVCGGSPWSWVVKLIVFGWWSVCVVGVVGDSGIVCAALYLNLSAGGALYCTPTVRFGRLASDPFGSYSDRAYSTLSVTASISPPYNSHPTHHPPPSYTTLTPTHTSPTPPLNAAPRAIQPFPSYTHSPTSTHLLDDPL